jgi:hypothetical protein
MDPLFLQQSLPEMFMFMVMYVVYLGMGHMLLCKTIKAKTIHNYVLEAAKLVQKHCEAYARAQSQAGLTWFSPTHAHGSAIMVPEIMACLKEITHWESMMDRHEPLTVDMIHYQKHCVACPCLIPWNRQCMIGKPLAFMWDFNSQNGHRKTMSSIMTKSSS